MSPVVRPLPLHELHASLGATFGVRGDAELVLGYADVRAERDAIAAGCGLADRSQRALVLVQGKEAKPFLQGMVTCDVALPPGKGAYGAVVTGKGKMLGDLRALVLSDEQVLLDLPPEAHAGILEHLGRFLVSEDATVDDATGQLAILGLVGPAAGDVLARALGEPLALATNAHATRILAGAEAIVAGARPEGVDGYDVLVNPAAAAAVFEALRAAGATPVGDRALDAVRIERFVPRFGTDMTEDTIPLEANLDAAISYTKGCYVGQEVIARATYRGAVNRRLAQLRVPPGTAPGAQLLSGEKAVGRVTSVLEPDGLALAYVRRDHLEVGRRLPLDRGGEAELVRVPPPREGG